VAANKKAAKHKKAAKANKKAEAVKVKVLTKMLGKTPNEYTFVLADGTKLRSLFDLMHALQDMTDDVFRHHVTEFRNDFSTWVHDVFREPKLAEELRGINTKLEAELVLLRKMVDELRRK
jgi:hypothetical protein